VDSERGLVTVEPCHELLLADMRSAALLNDVSKGVVGGRQRVHQAPAVEPEKGGRSGEGCPLVAIEKSVGLYEVEAQGPGEGRHTAMHEGRRTRVKSGRHCALHLPAIEALGEAAVPRTDAPVGFDDELRRGEKDPWRVHFRRSMASLCSSKTVSRAAK